MITHYNTSLKVVPQPIQAEIQLVLELIIKRVKQNLAQVWLFGSYARGDAINDCKEDPVTGVISEYYSDIDILIVVDGSNAIKQEKWWTRLEADIKQHPGITSSIHLIRETKYRLADALRHSEYFYLDVLKEGILLHGADLPLPKPVKFDAETHRSYAVDYIEQFYHSVDVSKRGLELYYQSKDYAAAMYCLHQMTERLFYTYLLVLTLYKPRSHKLDELREFVGANNKDIYSVFHLNDKQELERFHFLTAAYVDARYKNKYTVDPEVLDKLIEQISQFQRWVLKESLQVIDNLIPEKNFSEIYKVPGKFLDLELLKTKKLPEAVVREQLEEIQLLEERMKAARTDSDLREVLLREEVETERNEKDAALERETQLLQKLKDAGLEP